MPKHRPHPLLHRVFRITRTIRYALLVLMLDGLRLLAKALSHESGLRLGRLVGRAAWLIDGRGRERALRQLAQAGLGGSDAHRRTLARQVFQGMGMNVLEWLHALRWTPEQTRRQMTLDAEEILRKAVAEGRGIIFLSAHMGNWELLPAAFHALTGGTLAAVMAKTPHPLIQTWLIRWRETGGNCKLLPVNEALAIFRHLRRGGALALLADQDSTRSRGIFVDFFGRPAYTPVGPAHLARRTGAPLIPVVTVRDEDNPRRHKILMGEPIRPDLALDEETDIRRMTQQYSVAIEGWIRQYPSQWVWMHDRWKHRPGQKIRVRSARMHSSHN